MSDRERVAAQSRPLCSGPTLRLFETSRYLQMARQVNARSAKEGFRVWQSVRERWRAAGIDLRPGAAAADLDIFERRYGIRLPPDMRADKGVPFNQVPTGNR